MDIAKGFSLQGICFDGDFDKFSYSLLSSSTDPKTIVYIDQILDFVGKWIDNSSTISCHTSGSTGTPKLIEIEKTKMQASSMMTAKHFSLAQGTKALLCLPVSFIAGKMMLARAITVGWEMNLCAPCSSPLANDHKHYDFIAISPLQLYNSADDLHRVNKILVGGGSISTSFVARLSEDKSLTSHIYQSYASTETLSHIAVREVFPTLEEHYTALDGISLSVDERDCLCVIATNILDQELSTNDIVQLLSPTKFRWIGRSDNVINSAGIKIHPEILEHTLSRVIDKRFFIGGLAHPTLGQAVVLFVEGSQSDLVDLELFINANIERYHIPKRIVFVEKFSSTHTGKIDRIEILNKYCNLFY